eukprot:8978966-Pyramimonas_sp.AAC.2
MPLSLEDRLTVIDSIDVAATSCFMPEDLEMIHSKVCEHHGSFVAFDTKLKAHLLLDPVGPRATQARCATWHNPCMATLHPRGPFRPRMCGLPLGRFAVLTYTCTYVSLKGTVYEGLFVPGAFRSVIYAISQLFQVVSLRLGLLYSGWVFFIAALRFRLPCWFGGSLSTGAAAGRLSG